jgi:hypothetical protein
MSISLRTHKLLWGACGNICARCKEGVVEDETLTDDPSLVGEEAHIVSSKADGPRYNDPLAMDRRDLVENLLILCNKCHKIVDDQVGEYTVAHLRQMKKEHEQWVKQTLGQGDQAKKHDDLVYAGYVDEWARLAEIDKWQDWSYGMLSHGRPSINAAREEQLEQLKTWILGRVWPGRYPELEAAFHNFRRVLENLLNTFLEHAESVGDGKRLLTCNYSPKEWLPEDEFQRGLDYHEAHVYLVMDLMAELTRAANYICEKVRQFLSPSFRLKEGVILAMGGPFSNGCDRTFVLLYRGEERVAMPYPGLEKFRSDRAKRDYCFGQGKELEKPH